MDPEQVLILWKVRCIHTQTKNFFDRTLVLDASTLNPQNIADIVTLSKRRPVGRDLLKYRAHFRESAWPSSSTINKNTRIREVITISLGDYFEDENGRPMDEIGVCRILTGAEHPIIASNVKSVLQLGPSPIRSKDKWRQEDSDILAHFLQVNRQIAKSRWLKEKCTLTIKGSKTDSQVPSFESLVYVSIYFRQLFPDDDKLFSTACNIYKSYVADEAKIIWVECEKKSFLAILKEKPLFANTAGVTNTNLIDAFLYGALLFHTVEKVKTHKRTMFKTLLQDLGRDKLVFSLNACLIQLYNHVGAVAPVIHQDFAHWQNQGNIPYPDILWQEQIFGN